MSLFVDIGRALYGREWLAPFSDALGVRPRNLQRWVAGQLVPPDGVWADVETLIAARAGELRTLRSRLIQERKGEP